MLEGLWMSVYKKSLEFQNLLVDLSLKYYYHEFQTCLQQLSVGVYPPDNAVASFLDEDAGLANASELDDEGPSELDNAVANASIFASMLPVGKIWEICGILCIMKSRQELDSLSLRQLLPRSGAYGNGNLSPKIQRLKSQSSSTTNFENNEPKNILKLSY
ncbi:UNVERIFIED_CONTAM: hypothetical protein Sradi_0777700 [Sesamum radiatum]|uniref:Uncharacterized protein n=1 Tax=Sesamum radiatum TaxID=300843 RepID=A0AAW2VPT5_SESRA